MDKKCYLAVQDDKIIGSFVTLEQAESRVRSEIENDKIKHILKRSIAKKILAGKASIPSFEDRYLVLEVTDCIEVFRFVPHEVYKV